jgi:ubiquitin-protein ligase E3 D
MRTGVNLEAEVVPPTPGSGDERSQLLLRCGDSVSRRLSLPTDVVPGPVAVSVVGGQHFQIKLPVVPCAGPDADDVAGGDMELDATYFQNIHPTSFICSSCSLPLVQATKLQKYRDLPSEHWAELVDAWMCHADQKLHEHIQKGSKDGFWPADREALVGGSYLLLRESAVVKGNVCGAQGTEVAKVSHVQFKSFYLSLFRTDKKAGIGFLTHGRLLAVVHRALERL